MTDLDRVNNLNTFMSEKIGQDGKIAATDYINSYKRWISLGGSISDFKYAYPAEQWLGPHEYKNLPAGWQPEMAPVTQDVKTLPEDQQVFINQVQSAIKNYAITFDEAVAKYPEIAIYLKP